MLYHTSLAYWLCTGKCHLKFEPEFDKRHSGFNHLIYFRFYWLDIYLPNKMNKSQIKCGTSSFWIFGPHCEFCLSVRELSPLYALLIRNKQADSASNFTSHKWHAPSLRSLVTHHTRQSSTHREQIRRQTQKLTQDFKKGKEDYGAQLWNNWDKEELSWKHCLEVIWWIMVELTGCKTSLTEHHQNHEVY